MLVVETIAKIRRAYFVQGKSIKAICRELQVSRKVVRKVLRSGATAFEYEREVQPLPKIGPWQGELDGCWRRMTRKPARERLTLIRVFEELRGLGYEGGYDAVRRYAPRLAARSAARRRRRPIVPLSFAPGEAYQFDWSHEVVLINGATVTVKVAHVRLCHSRMLFVRAYPRETQEMVFDAHDRAFAFFKGACTRGIYDNMKTAVETIFVGKERRLQPPLPADVRPLSGRAGRLHAGVGLGEGAGREPGRPGARALLHAAAAGQELRRAERLAARPVRRLRQGASPSRARATRRSGRCSRRSARASCPMPAASTASTPCRPSVSKTCLVRFDNNRYSVAASAVGRPVEIQRLCRSDRDPPGRAGSSASIAARFGRDQTIYDPWHYVPVLARKPGALRNGAPFKDWVLPASAGAGPPQAGRRRRRRSADGRHPHRPC